MAFRGVDYMLFDSLLSEEELLVRQTPGGSWTNASCR